MNGSSRCEGNVAVRTGRRILERFYDEAGSSEQCVCACVFLQFYGWKITPSHSLLSNRLEHSASGRRYFIPGATREPGRELVGCFLREGVAGWGEAGMGRGEAGLADSSSSKQPLLQEGPSSAAPIKAPEQASPFQKVRTLLVWRALRRRRLSPILASKSCCCCSCSCSRCLCCFNPVPHTGAPSPPRAA